MPRPRTILVTGGAGFIGSHTCLVLLQNGYEVVVLDDFSNSSPMALEVVAKLAGRPVSCYEFDLRDQDAISRLLRRHHIDAVMHFAAKKAVGESVQAPLAYYDVNVGGTISLLRAMQDNRVDRFVFSSSCSIYGQAGTVPISEDQRAAPANPYARSKWMCEQVLADACDARAELKVIALRYFNPVGAHETGLLGEDPNGVPGNVLPYLAHVAGGRLERLNVFGHDYPTPDGTGVRDYIHVVDVAEGHRVALDHLEDTSGFRSFNLGTGVGTSVLQLRRAFEAASRRKIPYRVTDRRPGDVAELVADVTQVAREWGWRATRGLEEMCRDAWRFQEMNPRGYEPRASQRSLPGSAEESRGVLT